MAKRACSSGHSIELEAAGSDGAGSLVIRFPFDVKVLACVRQLPRRRFDAPAKCWRAPPEAVVEVVDALRPWPFEVEPAVRALYRRSGGALDLDESVADRAPKRCELPLPRCRSSSAPSE